MLLERPLCTWLSAGCTVVYGLCPQQARVTSRKRGYQIDENNQVTKIQETLGKHRGSKSWSDSSAWCARTSVFPEVACHCCPGPSCAHYAHTLLVSAGSSSLCYPSPCACCSLHLLTMIITGVSLVCAESSLLHITSFIPHKDSMNLCFSDEESKRL